MIGNGAVDATAPAEWDRVMDSNVRSIYLMTRAASPLLRRKKGAVVNLSSVAATRPYAGLASYCVSKAAIDQLTRCAALDLAAKGVRVNAVNPGVVVTNLHRRGGMNEENYSSFLTRARETHPLGRPGDATEIADLIFFLASDAAGWITGETISIDGGRHLTCAR